MPTSRSTRRSKGRRWGTTTLEFAVTANVLFLFFFAALEFSRVNQIRNMVEHAIYEGARRGIVPGATAAEIQATVEGVLETGRIGDADIDVQPEVIESDTPDVTVTVTVPLAGNLWTAPRYFVDSSISDSLTLAREKYDYSSVE